MFLAAVRAAQYTDSAEKLKVFGDSLAALLQNEAHVDSEEWFIRQVGVLEPYHLRILYCWVLTDDKWREVSDLNGGRFGQRQWLCWSRSELEGLSGFAAAGELADELTRHGFLQPVDPHATAIIETGYDYDQEPVALWGIGGRRDCWMLDELGVRLIGRLGVAEHWAGAAFRWAQEQRP